MTKRVEIIKQEDVSLSVRQRSRLLGVSRSRIYYTPLNEISALDITLMNEIRDIYERRPFQGYKRMTDDLKEMGYTVNHKRIYRLMKGMGIQAIYPKMNLSKRRQADAVFPYLLKKHPPLQPHDCWNVDITYIKTEKGYVYLTALIDAFSRHIMGWHLSPLLDTESCLRALDMALKTGYTPKIINSDQGSQFTSEAWVWCLVHHRIEISMDGKGRWADNIMIERFWRTLKYEEVYLKSYESIADARASLRDYITWYNTKRRHSGIEKNTPYEVMALNVRISKMCGNVDNSCSFNSSNCVFNTSHELSHNSTHTTTTTTLKQTYQHYQKASSLSQNRAA